MCVWNITHVWFDGMLMISLMTFHVSLDILNICWYFWRRTFYCLTYFHITLICFHIKNIPIKIVWNMSFEISLLKKKQKGRKGMNLIGCTLLLHPVGGLSYVQHTISAQLLHVQYGTIWSTLQHTQKCSFEKKNIVFCHLTFNRVFPAWEFYSSQLSNIKNKTINKYHQAF